MIQEETKSAIGDAKGKSEKRNGDKKSKGKQQRAAVEATSVSTRSQKNGLPEKKKRKLSER